MMQEFLITINQWIAGEAAIAAAGCFLWGLVSVALSPCHMASIPLIVAYVSGQNRILETREAGFYAGAFSSGLFLSITLVGIVCAILGRMLGDVGSYWQILVGLILAWVALGMFGVEKCSMSGTMLQRLNVRGLPGAFVLGLAYGILSGSCTFGFIAPILAIITLRQQVILGIVFILLFAAGHCLPIVVAGTSGAAVRGILENRVWQGAGKWFRKGAAVVIFLLALYFITDPFF